MTTIKKGPKAKSLCGPLNTKTLKLHGYYDIFQHIIQQRTMINPEDFESPF